MKKLPLSVYIISQDEADRIHYTINSVVDWADEVIVVDSGSTDDTVKVSEECGAKVSYNKWAGYGPQKNHAEKLCRNEWVMNLDADEEVQPELRASIEALFSKGSPEKDAYWLKRKMLFFYEDKPAAVSAGDQMVRLYDRRKGSFKVSTVHDSVVLEEGAVDGGALDGVLWHRCFRDLSHQAEKLNGYTTMLARDMVLKGRRPSSLRLIIEPFSAFFKSYIMRKFVFYGVEGFIESVSYAYIRMMRLAKAREMWKKKDMGLED